MITSFKGLFVGMKRVLLWMDEFEGLGSLSGG